MIPVTVFTGFLGAGKTTIILDLIKKRPNYKVALLKNEFGDTKVDMKLLESHVEVTEISNGCLCCVLVGQLKNALLEIKEHKPDRIIIETSGSAFPAPIAWQIRELSEYFQLDAIITVIDCINFKGYKDTSYTAKLQAQYTDLILLNKHEQISERELDQVIDSVNELNTDTARIKWTTKLEIGLFYGLDSKLFELNNEHLDVSHHSNEVDLIVIESIECQMEIFEKLLEILPKDSVYRVKGLFKPNQILNWAFGRWEWTEYQSQFTINKLTVMGIDLFEYKQQFIKIFGKDGKFEFHKSQRPC